MLGYTEHLLVTLMEECDEISQRASKALRFGLTEVQPTETGGDGSTDNQMRIAQEVDDLLGVCELLGIEYGNREAINAKINKVRHFMNYARERGVL